MKRFPRFATAWLLCGAASLVLARAPGAQQGAQYVGSQACAECHDEQLKSYQAGPHGHAEAAGLKGAGCESCHGPGSLHVAAQGDSTNAGFHTIRNFRTGSPVENAAVCQTCHGGGNQFYWSTGAHARNNLACTQCHALHGGKGTSPRALLRNTNSSALCLSCHREKRIGVARSSHLPVREGAMGCTDCHNPHGSPGPSQVRAASVNDLCVSCHADKRGPFTWEHAPVRENCLNCHDPHGSSNEKLLQAKRPFLCQRCHITTRHPSTLYDAKDFASNRLFNRSCTNCHAQIHGSNHPSGQFFLR